MVFLLIFVPLIFCNYCIVFCSIHNHNNCLPILVEPAILLQVMYVYYVLLEFGHIVGRRLTDLWSVLFYSRMLNPGRDGTETPLLNYGTKLLMRTLISVDKHSKCGSTA